MQIAPIPTLDDAINQVRSMTAKVVACDEPLVAGVMQPCFATDARGYQLIRDVPVWGHRDGHHGEIILDRVRVPLENAKNVPERYRGGESWDFGV
jgi:alkylation response protein AidB-like acyl-CoA dehydrogenase